MVAPTQIRRARIYAESSFANDESGSLSSFEDLQIKTGSTIKLPQEMLRNERVRTNIFHEPQDILGPKGAEAELQLDLTPEGTVLDSGASSPTTSPPQFGLGVLLKAILGKYLADKGSTEDSTSSSTASSLVVDDGSVFSAGTFLAAKVSGTYEVRLIDSISTNTITPWVDFSGTPDDNTEVLNSHTFLMGTDPTQTLQLLTEELDNQNTWWLQGCQASSLSFDINLRQLAALTVGLEGANYEHDDNVSSSARGSGISNATYNDGDPVPFINADVIFASGSSKPQSYNQVDPSSVTIEPQFSFQPIPGVSGKNGRIGWRLVPPDGPFLTGSLTIPTESGNIKTYEDALQNRDEYSLHVQMGNTGGNIAAIALPHLQITDVQRADAGGLHGVEVSFKTYLPSVHNDDRDSPLMIGLL